MIGAPASRRHAARSDAGFTLMELLVALALLALMLAAMPGALRIGFRALGAAENLEREAARHAAMDFIEQRLSLAQPIYEHRPDGRLLIAFRGEPQSIAFVAPAGSGAASGFFRFEMKSIPDADGRNGVAANTTHYRPPGDDPDRKVQPQARLLLADTSIAFRYFGVATARGAAQWSDSWGSPDSFPELVEVSFAPTGAGSRRVLLVPLRLRPAP